MKRIRETLEAVFKIVNKICGVVLLAVMLLIMFEVVTRYILPHPFTVSDEYSGYALVAITFLGLASTMNMGGHIRITFAVKALPTKVSNWIRLITLIIGLLWSALFCVVSIDYVIDSFRRGMKSITPLMTLLGFPRLVIPLGVLLLVLAFSIEVAKAIEKIRKGISIEETTESVSFD